jgi:succinate-acetate transporter protein
MKQAGLRLAICTAITLWFPAYLTGTKSLSLVVGALIPAWWIIAFKDLGLLGPAAAGWAVYLALIGGILGIYTSAAMVLNSRFGRVILPMGAPFLDKLSPGPPQMGKLSYCFG